MAVIRINRFGGTAPRIPRRELPPHLAQTASNCDLRTNELRPLKSGLFVWEPTKTGTIQSIHKFADQYWFHWTQDVDVIRGPIAGDTSERTYFTGTDYPRVTNNSIAVQGGGTDYPNNSYRLGIPAPTVTPGTTLGAGNDCAEEDKTSATFAFTYLSGWGEEGPPSAASAVVDICNGGTITVTGLAAPTGNYNIAAMRIYCSVSGFWQYTGEVAIGQTSFEITAFDPEALGDAMVSETWYQPPDGMKGLCMMANGIAVGFAGNEIMPSAAFQPHAYPPEYRLTTDYPIVGIAAAGTALIVTTTGNPYLVMGTDPSALSMAKLESNQACVAKRSVVDMGEWVVWASPDGLVAAAAGVQPKVITAPYLLREQWQALKPESIHAYYWEDKYLAFYDTGTTTGGFIYDPASDTGMQFTSLYATAGYNDLEADALYLVIGGNIVEWNASTALTYTWKSKTFTAPRPISFGVSQVKADSYPLTAKLYADGVLKHTQTVTSAAPFRLLGGFLAEDWEVELTGEVNVREALLAESMQELATA